MERPRKSKRPLPPRKLPTECLCCGEENPWVINKVEFVAPFRDTEHSFHAEAHQCRSCDAISTTPEQVEVISVKVRDAHRKWISERLKKVQKELGVSLRELTEKSGIPFATLGRISSGEHLPEATTEKLLWMEIERLTQERRTSLWIQMEQSRFSATNGSIIVQSNPKNVGIYSMVLKAAAQSPLGNSRNFEQKGCYSNQTCPNLVLA